MVKPFSVYTTARLHPVLTSVIAVEASLFLVSLLPMSKATSAAGKN